MSEVTIAIPSNSPWRLSCPRGHSRSFIQRGLSIYDCLDCEGGDFSGRFYLRGGHAYFTQPSEGRKMHTHGILPAPTDREGSKP